MSKNSVTAEAGVKMASVSAVVTRADGRVENLGTIAYYHRNPFRQLLWRLSKGGRR